MQIMAWDAKRRMEIKMQKTIENLLKEKRQRAAENGGENSGVALLTQSELQQAPLLILRVHRSNLIEESLTQVHPCCFSIYRWSHKSWRALS